MGDVLLPQWRELEDWLTDYQRILKTVGFAGRAKPCGGNGWVDRLATMLQGSGAVDVINGSSVGATVEMVANYEVQSVPKDTTIIVIFEGSSDEKRIIAGNEPVEDFRQGFLELIETLRTKAPHARIFVGMLPDLSRLPVMPPDTGGNPVTAADPKNVKNGFVTKYLQLHASLKKFIQSLNVTVVDPYCLDPRLYDISYLAKDSYHPNDSGHAIIAQHFYDAIQGKHETCAAH